MYIHTHTYINTHIPKYINLMVQAYILWLVVLAIVQKLYQLHEEQPKPLGDLN